MRIAPLLALIWAVPAWAQEFTAQLPAPIPALAGEVSEGPILRYIDIKKGDGAPARPGAQYTAHYTGWLRDGTQFDSSKGRDPFQFVQGRRQVIAGFDLGFEGMKVGGKRRLFIPYQMAYGEQGRGKIPPKAELIFDIELLDVKDASQPAPLSDALLSFNELDTHLMALARAIPEEKYDWRPAPGVRSFREVFLHVAYGTHLLLAMANGAAKEEIKELTGAQTKSEHETLTKDQVMQKLAASLAEAKTAFETAKSGSLSRDIDFFGTATTQRGVFGYINTHTAEHLGQSIAYARMNGITPPWSK
jgi:peptidylprolyl isomerase